LREEIFVLVAPSPTKLYSTDGQELYADVLSMYQRGKERSSQYFQKFHVKGDLTETKRSRIASNLQKPKVTNTVLLEEMELVLCMDPVKLQKSRIYTTERVAQELALLNQELYDLDIEMAVPEGKLKSDLIRSLIEARRVLKRNASDYETYEEEVVARVKERYEGQLEDAREIISKEIKDPFFTFEGTESRESNSLGKKLITFTFEEISEDYGEDYGEDELVQMRAEWDDNTDSLMQEYLDLSRSLNVTAMFDT